MSSLSDIETFPFSEKHLQKFREELQASGSFDALMFQKQALQRVRGMKFIALYNDIEKYKRTYLTGVYQSLRPMYDTEMPYVFWFDMYETLVQVEATQL